MNKAANEQLIENARRTLIKAQNLCQNSNIKLSSVMTTVSEWQRYRSKLQFVTECIQAQGDFLLNDILIKGIGSGLIDNEWSTVVLTELVKEMEHWQKILVERIEKLDNISNDLDNEQHSKLGDFISRESVRTLQEKLKEVPVIRKQVDSIKSQYQIMLRKIRNQLLGSKIYKLKMEFEDSFGLDCKDTIKIEENFASEVRHMEQELVEFLRSFTDHFDKCKMLVNTELSDEDKNDLFKIVQRDDSELDSIMHVLEEAADEVISFTTEAKAFLNQKEEEKEVLKASIGKLLMELKKHEEYLSVFEGISNLIEKFKSSCMQDIQEAKELHQFYEKFEESYYSLLKEVKRRKDVASKMSRILQNCETQLRDLNFADIKERQAFLLENGNYLPENIWPGEIDDLSPLFTLEYQIRKI